MVFFALAVYSLQSSVVQTLLVCLDTQVGGWEQLASPVRVEEAGEVQDPPSVQHPQTQEEGEVEEGAPQDPCMLRYLSAACLPDPG